MSPSISRRRFIQSASATLAASALAARGVEVAGTKPRRVGLIGSGWYGKSDVLRLIQVTPAEVVAVCDVDKKMLAGAVELIGQRQKSRAVPRGYSDYREMLKERDLDIVVIGSPDHWHALQGIAAMEAGADVYLQKPISVDVMEGEALVSTARKLGRVVQVGTQRRSTPHLIDAKKRVIEGGLLGTIAHVEICCYFHMRANGNPPVEPVPEFLDYDMWTGPAPLRPYDGLPHRRWWRTFREYGNGITGDMCVHMLDTARWLLDLGWPTRISSSGGILVQKEGKSNISDTQTALFEYPAYNVSWTHRTWGAPADPEYPWSVIIYGDKGTLKASTQKAEFFPSGKKTGDAGVIEFPCLFEKEKYPEDVGEKDIELNAAAATRSHMKDFIAAIEKRSRPIADVEQAHISTASCILANLSMDTGRALVYDPAKRVVTGDEAATKLLARPYRGPWQRPAIVA